jgi:PIN domain nuclease of toxin-antitoxin system
MKLLLDTHALFWALTDPGELSRPSRLAIVDRANTVLASPVSAFEMSLKNRLGKMPEARPVLAAYSRHVAALGATALPLSDEHCLLAGSLDWVHRDPFDRLLAAQAIIEGCHLVTKDPAFAVAPGLATLW